VSRCGTAFAGAHGHSNRGAATPFAVSIDLIKARAHERARELAAELLPNGREECGYWRTGSIADDPGQSLAVTLQGPDRGMWCDYAASGPEGGGNLIQLAALVAFRGDVGAAIAWLKSRLGLDDMDPGRLKKMAAEAVVARAEAERQADVEAEAKRRRALGLFLAGKAIADSPVEHYLKGRGIDLRALGKAPGALAFHPEVWNVEAHRRLPCMLAAIVKHSRHVATHRTWLAPDGKGGWTKADLETPKMVLGSFKGGHIPLNKGACRKTLEEIDAGLDVWASEGIEDGLSAAIAKPGLRVVAGVTLGNLGDIELPAQVGRFVIIGQRDTNPKTLAALEAAIARQQERGREVWLTPPPAGGFKDVNEALMTVGQSGTLAEGRAA
jgi:hypothetical protein